MNTSTSASPSDLFNANGLNIVITGGGSGIGLAFATALARNGASKIFLLGRRLNLLEKAASDIDSKVIIPVQCDVADMSSVTEAVKTIGSHTSYVDVLVNNAGIMGPVAGQIHGLQTVQEVSDLMLKDLDAWASTFAINTTAVAGVSAAFLPLLDAGNIRRGWPKGRREKQTRKEVPEGIDADDDRMSQIITVASIASFNRSVTAGLAYTASKSGAMMVGKSMANFLAPFGIRSNIICPGREYCTVISTLAKRLTMYTGFPSEMTAGFNTGDGFPISQIPHGQEGRFENMAGLILSLVGKGGSYYNGDVRVIDGGRLAVMPATF